MVEKNAPSRSPRPRKRPAAVAPTRSPVPRRAPATTPPGLHGAGGPNVERYDALERQEMRGMKAGGVVCRGMGRASRGGGYGKSG